MKHLIEFWKGGGGKLGIMYEAVGNVNKFEKQVGKKWVVWRFLKKEFWKCIGFIILSVNYGTKQFTLWERIMNLTTRRLNIKPKKILV